MWLHVICFVSSNGNSTLKLAYRSIAYKVVDMAQDLKNLIDLQRKVECYITFTIDTYFGDIRFVIDRSWNMKNECWENFERAECINQRWTFILLHVIKWHLAHPCGMKMLM